MVAAVKNEQIFVVDLFAQTKINIFRHNIEKSKLHLQKRVHLIKKSVLRFNRKDKESVFDA